MQCLDNIPELVEFYRAIAQGMAKTEPGYIFINDLRKQFSRQKTRAMLEKKSVVRNAFRKAKNNV